MNYRQAGGDRRQPGGPARGRARAGWALLVAAALLGACQAREEVRGHKTDEDQLALIKPGAQSEADVLRLLGSPSSMSTFERGGNTWYYIARDTEQVAFWAEETKDQRVVAIDFGTDGKVADIRRYGMADGKEVEPVERITPTKGKELNVFEQFIGNIGKFNK